MNFPVGGMPFAVWLDDDILDTLGGELEDFIEVSARARNQDLVSKKQATTHSSPIHYKLLHVQSFVTDWTHVSCRLLHHGIPACSVKALGVGTHLRAAWCVDSHVAQWAFK